MINNPLNALSPQWLAVALVAGSSIDDDSAIIDMAGFEGAIFVTSIEDSVDTGVAAMTIEQNSVNSGTGMAALDGAIATQTSAANDDLNGRLLAVDVFQPQERYLRVNRTSTIANIAFGSVMVFLYGKKKLPAADDLTVGHFVSVASPAEA